MRSAPDPLLEELKKPAKLDPVRFELDEDEDEDDISTLDDDEDEIVQEKPKTYGFIALTIMPKTNGQFSSIALQATLTRNHFRWGAQKLYHRHIQDNPTQPILYSVASIAKPGYFDQSSSQTYPGILIYLLLDEVQDTVNAFEKMLTSARQLSASLHAELCDATRQPITTALIQQYRTQAKAAMKAPLREEEYQEW